MSTFPQEEPGDVLPTGPCSWPSYSVPVTDVCSCGVTRCWYLLLCCATD